MELTHLVANFVLILHETVSTKFHQLEKRQEDLNEMKHQGSDGERTIRKNLEITTEVFSKAANKMIGLDRDFQ
jgi:hypothetical protein